MCVCFRLPLLLPTMGKREARGGPVVRVGGCDSEDQGSEHAAQHHRQTGT